MAKKDDVKKSLQKKTKRITGIKEMIRGYTEQLGKALPSHMNAERIVRIALTTMEMNKKLYDCDPRSFLGALFQSAQLGLEPNVEGQAYIIPYGNKAQFQIGYKGYVELFYRHQKSISIDMQTVHVNDEFEYQYGTDSYLIHKPALKDRGEAIAYYAFAQMKDGARNFKVMSKEACFDHGKKHSKTFKNGPWKTDFNAMAKKTVLIQLMKILPKSAEIQKAIAMDETIKTIKNGVASDMFEVPDETDWDSDDAEEVEAEVEDGDGGMFEEKEETEDE